MTAEQLCNIPAIKAREVRNLGPKLARLARWHPPRIKAETPLLKKEKGKWKTYDSELAESYLKWQEMYHKRENAWKDYLINTVIRDFSSYMASQTHARMITDYFGHSTLVIECRIQPITMNHLRKEYALDVGDVYMHSTIPDTIFNRYDRELKEWFIRGLADTIATIDRYISKDKPVYRIQFSVINNNRRLPVDLCLLLQKHLEIPVYYIGWAKIEELKGKKYERRGTRDHLVKVWVVNFKDRFNFPLFLNKQKHAEFLNALEISLKHKEAIQRLLSFCPRGRKMRNYMKLCLKIGCKQIPPRGLGKWL